MAGTCAYMIENYNTGGININCYKITLPIKKGLSSSAAICVLVAESFNKVYDLKLSTDQIMDIAYKSELLTPSRCGRLDQICAYGRKLLHVIFDTNKIIVKEVNVKKTIFMLLADLHGEKDTIKILSALNSFYPFYENEKEVHYGPNC